MKLTDDMVKDVDQILKHLDDPKGWGSSQWLSSCLVERRTNELAGLSPTKTLRMIFDDALQELSQEPNMKMEADILRERYWKKIYPDEQTLLKVLGVSRAKYFRTRSQAILQFAKVLWQMEITCQNTPLCSLCDRTIMDIDLDSLLQIRDYVFICVECASESVDKFSQRGIQTRITRSIEFEPEYYQAGVGILNYFGTVLREKHSELDAKVRIEQEGLKVTLVVESPTGEQEKVEKALNDYGLVVMGKTTPEEFYHGDALKILELKQQLQMAQIHIESQREILKIKDIEYGQRIQSLEGEVTWLRSHVGGLLTHSTLNIESFRQITLESLSLANQHNEVIKSALDVLSQKLEGGITEDDEEEVRAALGEIKQEDPILFNKIKEILLELVVKGSIAGVSGSLLFEWLKWIF